MNNSNRQPNRGVIYVVTGGRSYIGELLASVDSLRRHEPDLPITVFSSFPVPERRGLARKECPTDENPFKLKVYSLRRSPYEETLFLDTDTLIRGPLQPLFDELDGKDFCVANAHVADYSVRPPKFIAMVKEGGYNTGVLLFRNSQATQNFLERWEDAVRAHDSDDMWAGHNCDQHYFNKLVRDGCREECRLRWKDLDNLRWNCRGIAAGAVKALGRWPEVTILHHRTSGMKMRKLLYSIIAPGIAKEIATKSWLLLRARFRQSS